MPTVKKMKTMLKFQYCQYVLYLTRYEDPWSQVWQDNLFIFDTSHYKAASIKDYQIWIIRISWIFVSLRL